MVDVIEKLKQEWHIIKNAPFSFVVVCALALGAFFSGFRWVYSEKLSGSDARAIHWKSDAEYWKEIATRPARQQPNESVRQQPLTEKSPAKVITRVLPAPGVEAQIIKQENFIPNDPRYGSGLKVAIATAKNNGPVQMFIICDGPIGLPPTVGRSSKTGQFAVESQKLLESHAEVWNVKWRNPEWTPEDAVTFEFLSRNPIHAKWAIPIVYNPNAP